MVIRRETISYSIARNKRRNKEGQELLDKMKECESKMENPIGSPEDIVNEYGILKKDYEQYLAEKTKGQVLRSKANWAEHGERSSKYFIGLEKHNQELKNIKTIITKPGCEATDPNQILELLHEYYGNVYNKNNEPDPDFDDFVPVNKLSTKDNKELESEIISD